MNILKTWHGSHRWDGRPEIRPSKKGQYECGPGIYTTTSLNTAAKYARGGGRIMEFTLDADITWLEDVKIPFQEALDFVGASRHISKRRILRDDLLRCFETREHVRNQGMLPLSYLVNLAVNNECLSGKGSPELAEFLVEKGAQASLHNSKSTDDWVIIFDPKVILSTDVKAAKDIDWQNDTLPLIKEQLEALRRITPAM